MTTLVIDHNCKNITVRSEGFCETYTLISFTTDYRAAVMMYVVEAEKLGNKVSMSFPIINTNKIIIENCISNTQ